ncbi:16052_t:CDS:2, partial [Cetraspora pellucida]
DIHSELHDASELLYLQLPEDVKLVLDKLRNLQRAENSVLFYDKKLPNGERQALSVIHENIECHYAGRSDQLPHSRYYARLSHSSASTFHSESSESSSKHSSLVKVLGASSLLTKIIGSILSHHHDVLMNSLTDSTTLDNFHMLCAQVSKEAKELAKQIRRITTQGKTDELVEYGQIVYNELVSHANNLVEALDLFVNFVHIHLPQNYEGPSKLILTYSVNAQPNEPLTTEEQKHKKRRSDSKQSINDLNVTSDNSDRLSGHSTVSFERGQYPLSHKFNVGLSSSWRSRNESTDSELSIASVTTVPIIYSKERKITFSESSSLHKPRFHNHISPLSNSRLYRKNMDLFIDTSSKNDPSPFYSSPNTPNTLNSNCSISFNHRNRDSYLRFNNEPVSPALSNSSKGSKFKEMLDESSFKPSLGCNIDQYTKKNRTRTQSFISRFMSNSRLSSSPPLSPISTHSLYIPSNKTSKSSLSIGNRRKKNEPRPRRVSDSSTKPHFFKHFHLPSRKGKISENTARTTNYCPVTEDPLVSESPANRNPNRFFRTPSLSGKRPKLHKINSDTDLRSLRKMWAERDQTPPLSAHVEDVREDPNRIDNSSSVEVCDENLRESLLRKIVTKK